MAAFTFPTPLSAKTHFEFLIFPKTNSNEFILVFLVFAIYEATASISPCSAHIIPIIFNSPKL